MQLKFFEDIIWGYESGKKIFRMCMFKMKFSDNTTVGFGFYKEHFKMLSFCAFSNNVLYSILIHILQ